MVQEFQLKRSAKIIQKEWKIFRFQLQIRKYIREMKDRALTRIQKVLRGYKFDWLSNQLNRVWSDTGAIRTVARMNALRKTLFQRIKRNKAVKVIQRWFRKQIVIVTKTQYPLGPKSQETEGGIFEVAPR